MQEEFHVITVFFNLNSVDMHVFYAMNIVGIPVDILSFHDITENIVNMGFTLSVFVLDVRKNFCTGIYTTVNHVD